MVRGKAVWRGCWALWGVALGSATGCVDALNALPFFARYDVELDITDVEAVTSNKTLKGTFSNGTVEALTEGVGSCSVQLKLGQCKDGEEIWINLRALQDDPAASRVSCTPSVWERIKAVEGKSLALAPTAEATRGGTGIYVEILVGDNRDQDGNGVVDKHTDENRLATRPLTIGRLDVHRATDSPGGNSWPPYGEFLADLEASQPGIGFVRGHVDAAVDAQDGLPVGPRCHWDVEQLQQDN